MRFFNTIVISASALATLVSAATPPIQFTDAPRGSIEAGDTFTLKYTGDEDVPATILLKKGPSNHLVTVSTITTSATGGSFKWTVPKDIAPGGDYALQIIAGADNNYWSIGAIAGGTGSASSSASSALSSASSKISSLSSQRSSATVTSAGTTTPTASRNSTSVSKPTLSPTTGSGSSSTSGSSSSSTTSGGAAAPSDSNGGAANLKSNAALVLGAVAAMAYLG